MVAFFTAGPARDAAYTNLRDLPEDRVGKYRCFVEYLWRRYQGNEDANFLSNARDHFDQRFWEMYLWVALVDLGFEPHKENDAGPDYYIELDGVRYWVEAVCPMRGSNPDAIPEEQYDLECRNVPVDKIMLTFTNAISKKTRKHREDIEKKRVSSSDGYILAISSAGLPISARVDSDIPYIVRACYGIGNMAIPINVMSMEMGEPHYQEKIECNKHNGVPVSLVSLRQNGDPLLSGIIYSAATCTSLDCRPGGDFHFLANASADVSVPWDKFSCMKRWRFCNGSLECFPGSNGA